MVARHRHAGSDGEQPVEVDIKDRNGVDALFAIPNGPITLETSLREAPMLLADTAENALRTFVSARGLK